MPALLPAAYCSDVHERLTLYKRLAELRDARGRSNCCARSWSTASACCPSRRRRCSSATALRIAAKALGVSRVDATHEAVQLQFVKHPPIDGAKIIALVQRRKDLRLSGPEKLRLTAKMPAWPERAQATKELLMQLAA